MNAQLRRRLEMAGRVREFLRAHKTDGAAEGLGLDVALISIELAPTPSDRRRSTIAVTKWKGEAAAR